MKIILISDVHGKWNKLTIPECDLLVSTGDYTFHGEKHMVKDFHAWLNKQPAKHIISVQGNHETWVEKNFEEAKALAESVCPRVHFIGDGKTIIIEGFKIFGSAVTPFFFNWAWNRHRGMEIAQEWEKIEPDTDIVLTHGPMYGFFDLVYQVDGVTPRERVGCEELYKKVMSLPNCKLHSCGHIHSGYGVRKFNNMYIVNASNCSETYRIEHEPIVIELDDKQKEGSDGKNKPQSE